MLPILKDSSRWKIKTDQCEIFYTFYGGKSLGHRFEIPVQLLCLFKELYLIKEIQVKLSSVYTSGLLQIKYKYPLFYAKCLYRTFEKNLYLSLTNGNFFKLQILQKHLTKINSKLMLINISSLSNSALITVSPFTSYVVYSFFFKPQQKIFVKSLTLFFTSKKGQQYNVNILEICLLKDPFSFLLHWHW